MNWRSKAHFASGAQRILVHSVCPAFVNSILETSLQLKVLFLRMDFHC